MRPPDKGGSRTPWQGPAPETSEAPPSTITVPPIIADPELLRGLARMAATPGNRLAVGSRPIFLGPLVADLRGRERLGTVRRCSHLRRAGGPAFLLPWQPGRLRCASCALAAAARMERTAEFTRCDACRATVDRLWTTTLLVDDLVIVFGACELCRLSGQAGPA